MIFGAAQIYLIVFYFVSVFQYLTIKYQNSDEVLRDRDKVLRKFFSEVGLKLFFKYGDTFITQKQPLGHALQNRCS